MHKPIFLVILDGWGVSESEEGNAIKKAVLPTIDKLDRNYPLISLQASGISAGIPWGEPGNSEVGHTILGSGKIIYQNLPRITLSIQDRSFFANKILLSAMENVHKNNSALHIMGLVGEGSVHSSMDHFFALIEMAKSQKIKNVFFHLFTDGRDSPPKSGTETVKKIQKKISEAEIGEIASVCGRNWAMDRNNNWDRTEKAYRMLTEGAGEKTSDPVAYMEASYKKNITDEYMEPGVVEKNGQPVGIIRDNDSVIFFNFREDRARQITKAFVVPEFNKIKNIKKIKVYFATMTEYEKDLPAFVVFPPEKTTNGLGEILSKNNKKQLRIAETEKYAHVTYFFNGGKEDAWPGEDRILVPSPSVSKYDEEPEMSAAKVTQKALESIELKKYDFVLMNYANADMIGHTGNMEAAITAVRCIDKSLSILVPKVLQAGGCLLITADHGNAEEMINPYTGQAVTEHSTNPVPLWFVTGDNHREKTESDIAKSRNEIHGLLSDVAPTVLDLMGIKKPEEMNGESLLKALK
ncbi:MAG: 2,3-bisphosphoglycerate-independent phosphoglycerate mutase [Candidatus Moranbacteria bacterium]|jgi:2,3-bisphosphoglycerate-independent phosphoglycerate mutase|nr:2,3-bisphosphoglycerate-independent phosphoglycerate mutase [Candidatus Moranbacteria bacterium]MDX9855397.1 2,3-bisphosphoglycerate-independent phosphoglycerate mutase [Candidatus Moranbacteria bacterium]